MSLSGTGLRQARRIIVSMAAAMSFVACGDDGPTENVVQPFSITFCSGDAPIWVAMQDGDGAWTQLLPTTGNTYELKLLSGRGGIATVDTVGESTQLSLAYLTADEMVHLGSEVSWAPAGCVGKTVLGSVANVAPDQYALIGLGASVAYVDGSTGSTFELTDVPDGPQAFLAGRYDGSTDLVSTLILRRGINAAAGSSLPVLDFGGAEAFAPASGEVTVTGLTAGEVGSLTVSYAGVDGLSTIRISSANVENGASTSYQAIPAAQLQAGEYQQFFVGAESFRFATLYFRTPAARTVALGPVLNAPAVSAAATEPYLRPRVQLTSQAEYNRLLLAFLYESQSDGRTVLLVSDGYLGGTPQTWDVTVPDLSAASGWNNSWGLQGGGDLEWTVDALGGIIITFGEEPTDGAMTRIAGAFSAQSSDLALREQGVHPLLRGLTERNRTTPSGRPRW